MKTTKAISNFVLLGLCGCVWALAMPLSSFSAEKPSDDPPTTLQYPNNPVADILSVYERLTGKRLIKDAALTGPNLSIVVAQPIPKSEAIHLIEAALLLNGYALITADENTVKVISATAGKNPRSEGVPIYATAEALPKGDQVVSYFMRLHYLSPTEAQPMFQQLVQIHPFGTIVSVPSARALVITENTAIIRRLLELQELVDVPPAKVTSEFVTLERTDAERVAEMINKILASRKGGQATVSTAADFVSPESEEVLKDRVMVAGDVQLIPDARGNRIMVVTRPINLPFIKALIKELDQPVILTPPLEIPLKYVTVAEVLPVLTSVLSDGKDSSGSAGTPAVRQATPPPPATAGGGGTTGAHLATPVEDNAPELVTVGKTRLIADKRANSVLVMGPPESVEKVQKILGQLDKRPRQVYLATVIGQLTLGDGLESSVDVLQKFSTLNKGGNTGLASGFRTRNGSLDLVPDPKTLITPGAFPLPTGLTLYGAIGNAFNVYVKALDSTNRFKVISRPAIYTSNNKKAVISSGQKVAVPTSTLTSLTSGSTTSPAVSASIEYKDVVLKLEVVPLINSNNEVTLQIVQFNDTIVGSQIISGNTIPTIGTQEINTTVTVPNRATIVLGGLITDSVSKNTTGFPWLSRIPVIGRLFGATTTENKRTELIVLIQPIVVESEDEMKAASQFEQNRATIGKDVQQAADPPKPAPLKSKARKSGLRE